MRHSAYYNVIMIVIFSALGYGFGKTLQVYRSFRADPSLYAAPNPSWIRSLTPTWLLIGAIIVASLIARAVIKSRMKRK